MLYNQTTTKLIGMEGLKFRPGVIDIDDTQDVRIPTGMGQGPKIGPLKDHPQFKDYRAQGVLKRIKKALPGEGSTKKTGNILEMGSRDSIAMVKQYLSIPAIQTFISQEKAKPNPRSEVIKAAEEQIAILSKSDTPK